MNFKDLVSTLAREAGVSGGGSISTVSSPTGETARLVGWIRQAHVDIQKEWFDWKFLWQSFGIVTEAGKADYNAPLEWNWWDKDKAFLDGNPMRRAIVEYELWDGYDNEASGKPSRIILMPDGSLKMLPTPDGVYNLSIPYYRKPQVLVNDTDIPLIPEQFHDVIWMRALMDYAFYEAAPEVLERVQAQYPARFGALESHQLPNRDRHHLAQDADPLVVRPE